MAKYFNTLKQLTTELLTIEETTQLLAILSNRPLEYDRIAEFDLRMGGPSIARMNCNNSGRYSVDDRSIFRPLQYCGNYIEMFVEGGQAEWVTRNTVHMSSLHLECLLKRMDGIHKPWPLGKLLLEPSIKKALGPVLWDQLQRYREVCNAAKHETDQLKDTHLFTVDEAILAYVITRKMGLALYPRTTLYTDMKIFDKECT